MMWSFLSLLSFLWLHSSSACSYAEIPWEENGKTSYLIPRTMELWNYFNSTNYSIEAIPRGAVGKYGYVAPTNIFHMPPTWVPLPFTFEGMNEVGLTVSALWFAQSIYEQPQPGKKAIMSLEVVPVLLGSCASVEEAIQLLESVSVTAAKLDNVPPEALQAAVLHWAITDTSGRSIVVEYIEGKRVIIENTPRVMTNDPDLKWHWRNLNTQVNLGPKHPVPEDLPQVKVDDVIGVVPRPIGHGWNLFGLPGDTTSASRFIRLFYLRGYAMKADPPKSFEDAVVLGTALLNNVFIPFGVVAADPKAAGDGPEYTDYGVLKSCQERVMLIRGYRNTQWRKIDLKQLDFTKARSWPLEDGSVGIQDITHGETVSCKA